MAHPMGDIRILMSSRVLLDLEKADTVFKRAYNRAYEKASQKYGAEEAARISHDKAVKAYTDYVCCEGRYKNNYDPEIDGRRFSKGPMWDFAVAALKLNELAGEPIVEIGLSCKDEAKSALPIYRNLDVAGFSDIHLRMATSGSALSSEDHESFGTDLLLTRNMEDAQLAINNGIAVAVINFPPNGHKYSHNGEPIQIWVDGDAVAFGSSSEVRYRREGLEVYREMEKKDFNKEVEPGPFTEILAKISKLNARFPRGRQPFEISLLTARGADAAARVFRIAQHHGIEFNGRMYFMGGAAKVNPLKAHKPDLYLDDQMVHLKESSKYCPTGLVAYPENSAMHQYVQEQAAGIQNAEIASAKGREDFQKNAKETGSAPEQTAPSNANPRRSSRKPGMP